MADFLLLMHTDTTCPVPDHLWGPWFQALRDAAAFEGGSAIGSGEVLRKGLAPGPVASWIDGYVRIRAPSLETAKALVVGNPVYECGGTVEVRELPED